MKISKTAGETNIPDSSIEGSSPACEAERFFRQVNIEFLIHELKDPLSIVETGALMLLEKQNVCGTLTERQQKTLKRILRGSRKAREMLYELLEVGRAEQACFNCKPFNPETVLRDVLSSVIEAKDPALYEKINSLDDEREISTLLAKEQIRMEVSSVAMDIDMFQDETKFRYIISNLLKNAFQYKRRLLLLHLAYRHDRICISVRDDGPGIASTHHKAIFERYKQVASIAGIARSGHGLGLAVARILARSLGGDITLESELGQGATFRLLLPIQMPGYPKREMINPTGQ
jgi:signal transduction histidine kinase